MRRSPYLSIFDLCCNIKWQKHSDYVNKSREPQRAFLLLISYKKMKSVPKCLIFKWLFSYLAYRQSISNGIIVFCCFNKRKKPMSYCLAQTSVMAAKTKAAMNMNSHRLSRKGRKPHSAHIFHTYLLVFGDRWQFHRFSSRRAGTEFIRKHNKYKLQPVPIKITINYRPVKLIANYKIYNFIVSVVATPSKAFDPIETHAHTELWKSVAQMVTANRFASFRFIFVILL